MIRKIATFMRLSAQRKSLLLKGFALAIYSTILFQFFNDKVVYGAIEAPKNSRKEIDKQKIVDIRFLIKILQKYIPWEFKCRHQAWIAAHLLSKYQIPYSVYIGFKKNEAGEIEGHAWTIAQEIFVSGFCQPSEYVIQSEYKG